MDSTNEKFWDFSFEEMADYDMPAIVDFVLEKTGNKKISFIGHSTGTTIMFAAMSTKPDYYRERINCFIAMAPVSSLHATNSKVV